MKIGIIGGGSIGLLYAFYLSELYDITLYTRTKQQAIEISKNGIQLIFQGNTYQRSITSDCISLWTGKEDITFIAVKQYQLDEVMEQLLLTQTQKTDFIFLQNGMGHLKLLNTLPNKTIYVCSVEHGANKNNAYTVEHNGVGTTKIALFQGENLLPHSLFTIPNFPFHFESNYYEMLLKKLIVNAIINPLTALLKVKNGEIIHNKHYFNVANNLFFEIAKVLQLNNSENYFQAVLAICQKTAENRSSMLKDLESNRPTEIDAILGFVLEEADKKKIDAPICQLLYQMIKGSEMGDVND